MVAGPSGSGKARAEPTAPSYQEMFRELEQAVLELEREELPLERAMMLFSRGVELAGLLAARLEEAEQRIYRLVAEAGGGFGLEPLAAEDLGPGAEAPGGGAEEDEGDAAGGTLPAGGR